MVELFVISMTDEIKAKRNTKFIAYATVFVEGFHYNWSIRTVDDVVRVNLWGNLRDFNKVSWMMMCMYKY